MNVTLEKKNDLEAIVCIAIQPSDYESILDNKLREYKKSAKVPGFRPGHAPLGMLKKMAGKSILYDEVTRMAIKGLYEHVEKEDLDVLGQPIQSYDKESDLDFDTFGDFIFYFDIGLAPKINLNISETDVIDLYEIELSKEEIDKEIEAIQRQNGELTAIEAVSSEKDSVALLVTELNADNTEKEEGLKDIEITILPEVVKNQEAKDVLMGATLSTVGKINLADMFNQNFAVMKHYLGLQSEDAAKEIYPIFNFSIKEIKQLKPAELNQDLFDKTLGENVAQSEDVFRQKIEENLLTYYQSEASKQRDAELNHLLEIKHQFDLPDAFLKRWLITTKEDGYNAENIDERYAQESKVLKRQLIRDKVIKDESISVLPEELEQMSMSFTYHQFKQYGLANADPAMVANYAKKQMEEKDYVIKMQDLVLSQKVIEKIATKVSLNTIKIGVEDFYKKVKEFNEQNKD